VVDWDSASIESYESLESNSGQQHEMGAGYNFDQQSNDYMGMSQSELAAGPPGSMQADGQPWMQSHYDDFSMGNQGPTNGATQQAAAQRNQPLIVLQGHRTGFLEQYIYTEQQLEQMKLQQQQKEMTMKPWERDI